MNELIEKQKKELDKLEYEWRCNCREQHTSIEKEGVYNWHINSIKEILEAEIGLLYEYIPPFSADKENPIKHVYQNEGYAKAVEIMQVRLTNIINNLK